jgi:peptidoglycan/xylan/chitin deacetylase (PgdA/CDA1 family)
MLVALTIDDDWGEDTLDILDEMQVVATFFPVAHYLKKKSRTMLDRTSRHEIGNHTFGHARLTEVETKEGFRQIKLANQLIEEYCGLTPQVFAYPCGLENPRVRRLVASFGFLGARGVKVKGSVCERLALPTHMWVEKRFRHPPNYAVVGAHMHLCGTKKLKKCISKFQERGATFITLSQMIRMGNMV